MHRRGFPAGGDRGARLFARSGTGRGAGTELRCSPGRRAGGNAPRAPGDPNLEQSRYIEAAVCGILVGNMYAPNGNPEAGAQVRLQARVDGRACRRTRRTLLDSGVPAILIGDYNVIPTDEDVYKPERWRRMRCSRRRRGRNIAELVGQGWTDAIRKLHPDERDLYLLALLAEFVRARRRNPHRPCAAQPLAREEAQGLPASTGRRAAGRRPATTRRCGSRSRSESTAEMPLQPCRQSGTVMLTRGGGLRNVRRIHPPRSG